MSNSANTTIVNLSDGRQVCLSYGVIVAAFIPATYAAEHAPVIDGHRAKRGGYLRTAERFSATTSRHINAFAGGDAQEIPHAELLALCAPVASRQSGGHGV